MSIKEKKILEKSLGKNVRGLDVLTIVVFAFALSWFADGIAEFLSESLKGIVMMGVSIFIFIAFYIRLYILNKRYSNNDDIDIKQIDAKPKNALVIMLSLHRTLENIEAIQSIDMTLVGKSKWDKNLTGWQMPLEAINFHLKKLKTIIVITSKESDEQYQAFVDLVERCFGKSIKISKICIDIDKLDDVKRGYHEATQKVKQYSSNDVVYDITSGNSLGTIAGSYFTINSDRLIEYVDTNSYEVKMYNNSYVFEE